MSGSWNARQALPRVPRGRKLRLPPLQVLVSALQQSREQHIADVRAFLEQEKRSRRGR